MRSPIQAVVVATALGAPVMSFAQSNSPLTRAQVPAELVQLENAGYVPGGVSVYYPDDIQAAEAKVAAQNSATGVGGVANSASDAGRPAVLRREQLKLSPAVPRRNAAKRDRGDSFASVSVAPGARP